MKKLILWSLGAVLFLTFILVGSMGLYTPAFGYISAEPETVQLPGFKTHRSKNLEIEFNYPEILKVREKDGVIAIEHSVNFEHPNPCDGSGLPPYQKSKKIFDFYIEITILPLTPTEVFIQEVMQFNQAGVAIEPRNMVRVTYGLLDGFRVYNGNHGCGPYSYFFQLSNQRVLWVDRYPAPEFREVTESEKQIYNRLRQIILPEQEEHIFRGILLSLDPTYKK